jgi:histone-lysine N-methyltransferase SETD2
VAKKLVNSDFKNGRVEDPTKISSKGERAVMKYAKEFFDKAVVKHREHERRRRDKARASAPSGSKEPSAARSSSAAATAAADAASTPLSSASDVEPSAASSPSGSERKRKREEEDEDDARAESLEREVRAASVGAKRARTVEGAPAAVDVPAPVGEEQEDDEERRLPPTPPSLPDAADPREDARERAEDGRGVGAGRPLPMVVDSLRGGAP